MQDEKKIQELETRIVILEKIAGLLIALHMDKNDLESNSKHFFDGLQKLSKGISEKPNGKVTEDELDELVSTMFDKSIK